MGFNRRFPLVRGRRMRATRLDSCGRIAARGCSSIVTKGFVSVALTSVIDEGEEITVANASGENCVRDPASPQVLGFGVQITFCDVDPQLYAMLTNQKVVYDANGVAVGFRVNSGRKVTDANFALELWSGVPGVACDDPNAAGSFGYFLLPYVSGGVIGDFTLENAAVSFVIQNAQTKDGTAWGTGPYNVVPSVGGTNEVQSLAISGSPTGGTYTLSFGGRTTAPLPYNANAATIQSALVALDNVDPGDITVTGTGPYTMTFGGQYGRQNVVGVTAQASFTGGTAPAANVTTTTPGVSPTAGPLIEALDRQDHLHVQYTTVAPPEPGECISYGPAATGATAGTPGTLSPVDSYPPETFAALAAAPLTATPSTAWTSGQHIVLGNGTKAYWNSTAWVAGVAP